VADGLLVWTVWTALRLVHEDHTNTQQYTLKVTSLTQGSKCIQLYVLVVFSLLQDSQPSNVKRDRSKENYEAEAKS